MDQLPDQDLALGSQLLKSVSNPFSGLITTPGALSSATIPYEQLLRPYPQYLGYENIGESNGDTNYQAMLVKFQKRFQSAGNILVSYTWSKWMTNVETATFWNEPSSAGVQQDFYNLRADWAPSSNDVPHNLVVSYSLGLPFGQGKKFLPGASGPLNKMVSGWGINGIYTLQSGVPIVVTDAVNNSYSYDNTGITSTGAQRPNLVAGCNVNVSGSAPVRANNGWFNTNCFTQPAPFTFGDSPREFANLRGAGINNSDFALFKDTKLNERFALQFRAEFFNLWNRVQFGMPGNQYGAGGFGDVFNQANNPRLVQLALRLEF